MSTAQAQLPRPGVEVIQQFQSASPTLVTPTLVPFIAGTAKEVISVTDDDGLLNPQAKEGTYAQLPRVISQTAFPSPRSNIAEVNVEEASIEVYFNFGGTLKQLARNPGEAFLVSQNLATRAALRSEPISSSGLALDGQILILAVDIAARLNTTKDVTVTFSAATPLTLLTPAQICTQINNAVGQTVATVITGLSGGQVRIEIASTIYGAGSSVTVRAGGSGNDSFGFQTGSETRVEGSGFYGEDQNNNTTRTPWIKWSSGRYLIDGTSSSLPTYDDSIPSSTLGAGFLTAEGVFTASAIASSTAFTGSNSLDLKVGDQFYADGVLPVSGAVIMKVETDRFKIGTVNSKLSTFDTEGTLVNAVYDAAYVSTLFAASLFGPRYAWFKARNLTGNPNATAAALTGTTTGNPAETATITSPAIPAGSAPYALAGLTLDFDVTIDGVEQDTQTFTFTGGPFADLAALVAAVNAGGLTGIFAEPDVGNTKIAFSTVKEGADQALTLKSSSTALAALGFVASTSYDATGKDVEFVDVAAALLGGTQSFPLTLGGSGETLAIQKSTDGGATYPTTVTHTFTTAGPFANIAALVAELTSGSSWGGSGPAAAGLAVSNQGNKLLIKSVATGSLIGIKIGAGSTSIGNTSSDILYTSGASDVGEENLNGQRLKFRLNTRPLTYSVLFTSNSLVDAVAAINNEVGFTVASIGGVSTDELVLTSPLAGYASYLEIIADSTTAKAIAALGFGTGNQTASGTGRPDPDLQINSSGNVVLGAEILRSTLTGIPFNSGGAETYIAYQGLRLDVSPLAKKPGLLRIGDTTTLSTVLNPINTKNPLGLGMFFQIINAPGITCTSLGVDATSAAEPYGTQLAYSRVLSFVESEEIYAMAPLTDDEVVAQMFITHAVAMAAPTQKGERIVFFNPPVPTRAVPTLLASGTSGDTTATSNEFLLDVNPTSALVAEGLDPLSLAVSDDVYLEVTITTVSGSTLRRYNVSSVNSVLATLNVTFSASQNTDGFFTTTPLTEALTAVSWSLFVRGVPLVITGSTLPDKDAIASTVATKATQYKERRAYYVFPDTVSASIDGIDTKIPAFYACAAITGMVANFPPQQGFTNLPMTGFTGVLGSNDTYSNKQLSIMAAGGVYILIQEAQGAPLICRHQLSTNTTTIETRELSITKVVDFVAKFLRTGLRNFIGTFNVTQPFLDTLSTVIQGMLGFLSEQGVIIGADLNNLIQSKTAPDTVLVDITLDVPYPCNYIRLTLVI